jgi:hypothetical protein
MGGWGSGNYERIDARKTTDEVPRLDVRVVNREGHIAPGQKELIIREGMEPLLISWTPIGVCGPHSGPLRPWFVCPGEECGRRAAILYLDPENLRLLCRLCLDLAYTSQREDLVLRAKRRAVKARTKLAPDDHAPRPKGMHQRTFVRLGREYAEAYKEHVRAYNEWAGKLSERLAQSKHAAAPKNALEEMERERIWLDSL